MSLTTKALQFEAIKQELSIRTWYNKAANAKPCEYENILIEACAFKKDIEILTRLIAYKLSSIKHAMREPTSQTMTTHRQLSKEIFQLNALIDTIRDLLNDIEVTVKAVEVNEESIYPFDSNNY